MSAASSVLEPAIVDPPVFQDDHDSTFEMADRPAYSRANSKQMLLDSKKSSEGSGLQGVARHTLGLCLLLVVVFLWTLSNFLGSVRAIATPSLTNTDLMVDRASSQTIHMRNPSSSRISTPPPSFWP